MIKNSGSFVIELSTDNCQLDITRDSLSQTSVRMKTRFLSQCKSNICILLLETGTGVERKQISYACQCWGKKVYLMSG